VTELSSFETLFAACAGPGQPASATRRDSTFPHRGQAWISSSSSAAFSAYTSFSACRFISAPHLGHCSLAIAVVGLIS